MRQYSIGVFLDILEFNPTKWEEDVAFIRSLQSVEHIEILLEYLPTDEELDFFRALKKEYTLIVHAPFLDLTLLSPHEEIVEVSMQKLTQAYEIAMQLEAKAFTLHVGSMPNFWTEEKVFKHLEETITRLQKGNVPISVENMTKKMSLQIPFPYSVAQMTYLASYTGLTLDIGHFMKMDIDPLVVVEKHSDAIQDIHFHDCRDGKDHIALGTGILDIARFLHTLERQGYNKFLTLEIMGKDAIRASWKVLQKALSMAGEGRERS